MVQVDFGTNSGSDTLILIWLSPQGRWSRTQRSVTLDMVLQAAFPAVGLVQRVQKP
jgi:hypothetical protein